jgi:hypothetical protein
LRRVPHVNFRQSLRGRNAQLAVMLPLEHFLRFEKHSQYRHGFRLAQPA